MWDRLFVRAELPAANGKPMAAVLAVLFEDEAGESRTVLMKRPDTMPTHAGHIAFPGGRPDPGDQGPVDTALREAHEEVGIEPDSVDVLGFLDPVDTVQLRMLVVPVVGRLPGPPRLVPSAREVDRIYTPRLADLADASRWRFEMWRGRRVWFYDLEGDTLWGATAFMTRTMLGLET